MTGTQISTTAHQQIYETDFVEWVDRAAELLKQGNFSELDIEHLVEEVEDLGRSQRQALKSNLRILLIHLLKWQYQSDKRSSSWISTVNEHRDRIYDLLEDSPSLRNRLLEDFAKTYTQARKRAASETGLDISKFPAECLYAPEQVLDDEYWPEI
ncbi:hypothetical protein C1752_02832 [Acaryochloris thomasi RCC1774]|uniref:DUF29 domain-containing protein n=1 Tax=Acaryochloris thomasi RCC1774 TaxID=1764569 RepID=A0A2W1JWJ3_9CYAN|nr:DUF29 domain-containing protein [Acaryochloris thomasi]PZD73091.1 hypothetical protein C1752_02832 [Acaryochloris thomasi RCC1774]